MPNKLISVVAPDEYQYTIFKINKELDTRLSSNIKVLLGSCICLCCTLGLSIFAPIVINQRAKERVEAVLDEENKRWVFVLISFFTTVILTPWYMIFES
nr:unnamed protein product [Callosobruchus analis]